MQPIQYLDQVVISGIMAFLLVGIEGFMVKRMNIVYFAYLPGVIIPIWILSCIILTIMSGFYSITLLQQILVTLAIMLIMIADTTKRFIEYEYNDRQRSKAWRILK